MDVNYQTPDEIARHLKLTCSFANIHCVLYNVDYCTDEVAVADPDDGPVDSWVRACFLVPCKGKRKKTNAPLIDPCHCNDVNSVGLSAASAYRFRTPWLCSCRSNTSGVQTVYQLARNKLACSNCHLHAGQKEKALPLNVPHCKIRVNASGGTLIWCSAC